MTFVADEGVSRAVVRELRRENHDVLHIAEMLPSIPDEQVLAVANNAQALLLTEDKDFGELVFRLGRIHKGVILLRLHSLGSELKAQIVVETVRAHGSEMTDAFTVIARNSVRIRPMFRA